MNIYLDESGDLGWTFDKPYRNGGSSKHLTIACLCITADKKHLTTRLIKNLYKRFNWNPKIERKWSDMNTDQRTLFAEKAAQLKQRFPQVISYFSITVNKQKVSSHIRQDPNKLYNYMINLLITQKMSLHDKVTLIPDPRSIKVESGRSLHDYLQTQLWFEHKAKTILTTIPCDSASCSNVQFADMLSGVVQGFYEDSKQPAWHQLEHHLQAEKLFF